MAGNCNSQLPFEFAVVLKFFPLNFILIVSFLAAHPQIFIFESLCSTILSLISRGSFTCPVAVCISRNAKQKTGMILFFFILICTILLCVLWLRCVPCDQN